MTTEQYMEQLRKERDEAINILRELVNADDGRFANSTDFRNAVAEVCSKARAFVFKFAGSKDKVWQEAIADARSAIAKAENQEGK